MTSDFSIPHGGSHSRSDAGLTFGTCEIGVIGIGGGGGNAINSLAQRDITDIRMMAANTDAQDLASVDVPYHIQLGPLLTGGAGAGMDPDIGYRAAQEAEQALRVALEGLSLLFIVSTLGGGTGSGATPFVARLAREMNILTVSFVTTPFDWEFGKQVIAQDALKRLAPLTDTLIVGANEKLLEFQQDGEQGSFQKGLAMMNDVLAESVRAVSDLVLKQGLINLDFADVKRVLLRGGRAQLASGQARGQDRAHKALEKALSSHQLLDNHQMGQAKRMLINVTGNVAADEMPKIIQAVRQRMTLAEINCGVIHDTTMNDSLRVTIIASGFEQHNHHYEPHDDGAAHPFDLRQGEAQPSSPPVHHEEQQTDKKKSWWNWWNKEEKMTQEAVTQSPPIPPIPPHQPAAVHESIAKENDFTDEDAQQVTRQPEDNLPLFRAPQQSEDDAIPAEHRESVEVSSSVKVQEGSLRVPSWGHNYGKKDLN